MIQLKKIALAASAALALGVVTHAQAKGGPGGLDSARDKIERKVMQEMQQIAKGGHDRSKAEHKAKRSLPTVPPIAKGGADSARDKAERKVMEDLQQRNSGGTNSTRDTTERNVVVRASRVT